MTINDLWGALTWGAVAAVLALVVTWVGWPVFRPRGQHRAAPAPAGELVPLAALLASGAVEPSGFEWCAECTGRRAHIFHADQSRTCLHCGHEAKAGEL